MVLTDGSGIYRQDAILGPFHEDKDGKEVFVPQIEEIRAIRGADGETYYNARDLTIAMRMVAFEYTPTMSVLAFIKRITIELITARR